MAVIDDLIKQIQSQGTIGQWKGSVGSDVALKGMAKALADQGITNINQVGMITEKGITEDVRSDGRGNFFTLKGQPVDPSIVTLNKFSGESGEYDYYSAPVGTQQTIGNKETGQPLRSAYGTPEKTDPNMFGGTGEGKGGTSYNVQFDQAGNPIFYANKVASQSAGTINFGLKLAAAIAGLNGLEGLMANPATAATQAPTSGLLGGGEISGSEILARDLATDIGTGTVGGMTEAQLAQANMALGGAGGSAGAAELEAALASGTPTITNTALTGGSGILTGAAGGITADSVAAKLAADSVIPSAISNAATAAKSPLSVSDAIRLAGIGASLYGANKLANSLGSSGSGGYDIVPIPSDWTSPIKPTGTAEFTPLAPIDFGNKEMLRGTQWEQLLSPDYGKAPAMPTMPNNPSNMTYDQLTKILGGSRESIPSANLSINDVIAGIQNQYGQAPKGSMG